MISFFIPLIYILFANATTVAIFNKKFGKCLPITLLLSAFPLYFSGLLFTTFKYGILFNIIYACISLILIFIRKKDFVKNYFTNGFYACLILYLIVFVYNIGRDFTEWDEFSHWGAMVKEMFRLDNFYSVDTSTLMIHKDYPPIVPLFEFFWAKLCGGYGETYLLTSLKFLMFSFLMPVIENLKKESKKKAITQMILIGLIATLLAVFFDVHNNINTIYIDFFIAFFCSNLLFDIFTSDDLLSPFSLFKYGVTFSFLLLTKQICLAIYIMILFFLIGRIIQYIKASEGKVLIKATFILSIFALLIPIFNTLLWNDYISNYKVDRQFDTADIELSKLPGIINKTAGKEYQQETANLFIDSLYSKDIANSYIKLSYIQIVAISLVIMYFIYKKFKDIYDKKEYILLTTTVVLGYIGYAFVLMIMYVFCFWMEESLTMASMARYTSSFILIVLYLCLMLYFNGLYKTNQESSKKPWLILLILFICQVPYAMRNLELYHTLNFDNDGYKEYAHILKLNVPKGAKVYQINQYMDNGTQRFAEFFEQKKYNYYVHYYSMELPMNIENCNFSVKEDVDSEIYFNDYIKGEMMKYDYVYLIRFNEDFIERYSFLFESKDKINVGAIYHIIKDNGNILLKEIDHYEY